MKTLKKIIIVLILCFGSLMVNAQQSPMYTHYMYNTLVVNPAYAGSRDGLTVTALHRSQWLGFKGAPMTQTITMHAPLVNEHIGLGLSVFNDKIGPTNNTSIYVDFAYILRLTQKSKLAFGLSGGINILQADLNSLELDVQQDPVFLNSISNKVTPNFGFGVYYYRECFYAGVSVPSLIQNRYELKMLTDGSHSLAKENRHYYFIAGGLIKMARNLAFKPTTLVKMTVGAPIQADFTASFLIMNKLTVGGMFRTGDSYGALVGLDITDQLHIGYSFDWSYGVKTLKYNNGSHELMLRYDFFFADKKQIHAPRYF